MEEFDLKAIWQQTGSEEDLPSVARTAQAYRRQSLNLVERIKTTAQKEHRVYLIAAAVGLILLTVFGYYFWTLGLLVFSALIIWKYEIEMRLFNQIKPEDNTLNYLRSVSRLLQRFMRNYRIGILIFVPVVAVGSALYGQWLATGTWDWEIWTRPLIWFFLIGSVLTGILFSNWWLKFWVKTFYGRKLKAMEEMIRELSGDE